MKARNTFLTLALLAAAGFFFNTTGASAALESFSRNFGMVGITQGQTARLSIVSVDNPDIRPIQVELIFLDQEGRALAQSRETLTPGRAASLDLHGNQIVGRGGRTQLRAMVRFVDNPDLRDDPFFRHCLPTLEVIDNTTGRTSFIVPLRDDPFFRPAN